MEFDMDNHTYTDGKRVWKVLRLIELSKKFKAFKIPLNHLNIYNLYPQSKSTLGFVSNVKRVINADLSCPIILDEEGYVMDGRHRVVKSLVKDKKYIWAVRFKETPYHDYENNDEAK